MYLCLIYLILNIVSAISNPVPPHTVYDAIRISAKDPIYKCPLLRASKLFQSLPEVLKNCNNFTLAQGLGQLEDATIHPGLCILLFNNVENLCYVTNGYSLPEFERLNLTDSLNLDSKNIESVCTILVSNKSFVNNAKPGIDVITSALQKEGVCNRVCTDALLGKVKPICSLSAYFISSSKSLEHKDVNNPENAPLQPANNGPPVPPKEVAPIDTESKIKSAISPDSESRTNILTPSLQTPNDPNKLQDEQIPSDNKTSISNINDSKMHRSNTPDSQRIEKESEMSDNSRIPVLRHELIEKELKMSNNSRNPVFKHDLNDLLEPKKEKSQIVIKTDNDIVNPANTHEDALVAKVLPDVKVPSITPSPIPQPHRAGMAPHNTNDLKQDEQTLIEDPKSSPPKDSDKHVDHASKNVPPDNLNAEEAVPGDLGKNGETPANVIEEVPEDDDIEIEGGMASVGDGEIEYPNDVARPNVPKSSEVKAIEVAKSTEKLKPLEADDDHYSMSANYQNQNIDDSDSYFFSYFMMFCIIFICGYVAYHNKQKILALVVEGRKGRRPSRSKRPNSANYRKLDSNLEEAVTSTCNKQAPQVIY